MRTTRSSSRRDGLPQCMLGYTAPRVWAWRPPPGQTPQLTYPLGVGLETCNACWDTTPPPVWTESQTGVKNITFPQLRLRAVNIININRIGTTITNRVRTKHSQMLKVKVGEESIKIDGRSVQSHCCWCFSLLPVSCCVRLSGFS